MGMSIRSRAVAYAKERIMHSSDWQEVQNDLANHDEFGNWFESLGESGPSEAQNIIREAERTLGAKIPSGYAN
jgi:hypothetical protein